MARPPFSSPLDRLAYTRVLRQWHSALRNPDAATLAALRETAAQLQPCLDAVAAKDLAARLSLPAPDEVPGGLPPRTDWVWRPAPWAGPLRPSGWAGVTSGQGLGDGVTVHHDCPLGEVSLRQQAEPGGWSIALDWAGFAGTYLSIAIPLPEAALAGLTQDHVIALTADRMSEVGGALYTRFNIRNGPNMAQASLQGGFGGVGERAEFDLAYVRFDENRVEGGWIDVIFEARPANRVALRNVVLTRHRRAAL